MKSELFSVYLNNQLIGIVDNVREDWPWTRGRFMPSQEFNSYKHLFDREMQLTKEKESAERETVLEKIWSLEFRLESPIYGSATGCKVADAVRGENIVAVHIHEGRISWRE